MRAIEYADIYNQEPGEKQLARIATAFILEANTLAQKRHAKSLEALLAILREQITKWKAFVRIVADPAMREDGLRRLIIIEFPFIPEEKL